VLILLDVEGAEKKALEGATMMLRNDPKPIWLIEIAARENQPAGIEINPDFESTFEIFLIMDIKHLLLIRRVYR
jgi:hypothetical protein